MSKERLGFDLERETKRLKEIVDKDDRLTISSRFMKYFIEQTERLQELEEDYKVRQVEYLEEHIDRLEQQNKRYREVLEFYSKESNYSGYLTAGGWVKTPINDDNGETARQALKGESE